MKILVSSTTTSRPPLITLDTLAVIASLLLNASSSLLLPLSATSFLYVRRQLRKNFFLRLKKEIQSKVQLRM